MKNYYSFQRDQLIVLIFISIQSSNPILNPIKITSFFLSSTNDLYFKKINNVLWQNKHSDFTYVQNLTFFTLFWFLKLKKILIEVYG